MTHATTTPTHRPWRPLGLTWLAVSVPVAVVAALLLLVSDHQDDRTAGLVLLLLVAAAVALGTWLVTSSPARARDVSLATSVAWLVGAAVVYPTQEYVVDALWVTGTAALGAVVTAVVAVSVSRRTGA